MAEKVIHQVECTMAQNRAFSLFSYSNAFHCTAHPFVRKMESEIVSMTVTLFGGNCRNGPRGQCGILTTGGTESIILALRAYVNYARKHKNIHDPELIVPNSAHGAFHKGCDLMNIKIIRVNVDDSTYCVSSKQIEKYITSQTIAIIASAPQFAQGVMDPISDLSALAVKYDIGLHIDCCLGSFMLPTLKLIGGYHIPEFDFTLDGVTSISCDTHKFGFAPKGTSVVMFKNKELRKHAYFCYPDLSQGLYATATIAGSRSGGLVAATWVTMMHLGYSGYVKHFERIMKSVEIIKQGLSEIKYIEIMGYPVMSIIGMRLNQKECNQIPELDIMKISAAMSERGWKFDHCQSPTSIHFCFTVKNCEKPNKFLKDMKESINDVMKSPDKFKHSSALVYRKIHAIPSKTFKKDILASYWDVMYGIY